MIETFKKLVHQHLYEWLGEKSGPCPLFLRLKPRRPKWKASNQVCFMTILIGCN